MTLRELQADFSTGSVQRADLDSRPDAIVPTAALAPGPDAVGDLSEGLEAKAWYVRADNVGLAVYLAGAEDADTWGAESELFTFTGDPIDRISLCFDSTGRPVVAMERAGKLWLRWWDGATYQLQDLGVGASPQAVHHYPGSVSSEVRIFYERAGGIRQRQDSSGFLVENTGQYTLQTGERIERVILDAMDRIHIILSVWDSGAGQYTLKRVTGVEQDECLIVEGYDEIIYDGSDVIYIFRESGTVTTNCDVTCDLLLVGAGGTAGGSGRNEDTIFWADAAGVALDPLVDTPYSGHEARGGGAGASNDTDGSQGGAGGGGGAASPSNNTMWSAGGGGTIGQGGAGGGGESTWGLLDPKRVASGGGGGSFGDGGNGTTLRGAKHTAGLGGSGRPLPEWSWTGPKGGDGAEQESSDPSVVAPGGGGAGGTIDISDFTIPAGQVITVEVGQGDILGAAAGQGEGNNSQSTTGLLALRTRQPGLDEDLDPAELSGGTESVLNDYRYHLFISDGVISVTTPGEAEALVIGGGAGGGSGAGGGGGAGEVRLVNLVLEADEDVTIGQGGAGGTAGNSGESGGTSRVSGAVGYGGGGGGGNLEDPGDGASGGGGGGTDYGFEGGGGFNPSGGLGSALRGYDGGRRRDYTLSAGGSVRHAGGGGGAGENGDQGATRELTGNPLADNWEDPSNGEIILDQQRYRITLDGGQHYGLISERVSRQVMMVQGKVISGHANLNVGIRARGRHTTGLDDDPTEGWAAWIDEGDQRFRGLAYLFDLGSAHVLQAYVEDSLQEYSCRGPNGNPRAVSIVRDSASSTTYNGLDRSFGFYCEGSPISGTNKQGICDELACFASKYLTIGNAPTGGSAEVLNASGVVVGTGTESGGEILVDLSMYGNGTTGAPEPVPIPQGFSTVVVYDSGASEVARASGSFYPGGEFDVNGTSLDVRVDSSGAEPVPVIGLLHYSDFSELTPGPLHGDGGDGRLLEGEWLTAIGMGEDGYIAAGGGGGAQATVAGAGGAGGGGNGAYGSNSPTAGAANTGSGGGGSGQSGVAGGAGAAGLVALRTQRFPDTIPVASRFSSSAIDQDNDGGVILVPNTDEVISHGDVQDWNNLTAFTIVLRHEPDLLNSQRNVFSRFSTSGSLRRQLLIIQRSPGTDFGVILSQGGADYGALWRTNGWSLNDYMYAVVFDGSLTGPGASNLNRLKFFRDINDGNGFQELAWSFTFFSGRSDVPSQLMSTTGLPELYGDRDDGASDSSPGVGRLLAIKYGTAYSGADLNAMDLWDKPNIDLADWDRLYRYEGHIADEIGSVHGTFDTPR